MGNLKFLALKREKREGMLPGIRKLGLFSGRLLPYIIVLTFLWALANRVAAPCL